MEEEDLHSKQQYLRREIMDQGYDPQDFNNYMCSIKQEENIDLNNWSFQEIVNVVESFKESLKQNEEEDQVQNEEEPSPISENLYNEEVKENTTDSIPFKPKINIHSDISRSTMQSLENQINSPVNSDAFDDYQKIIPCQKLEKNELTYREDLYVTISEPVKVNPGFFSFSYYQYTVKTYPLNYAVLRKVSDFSFLNQKLPLIHPAMYTPSLPHFSYGLKDDSPKKMLYIQNYMNLLIENRFFRTLPIVYDFLTLPQPDWNKKVKSKYRKINEVMGFDTMPNLEGKYLIKITKADEDKARKIKPEINSKNEALVNLNSTLDELINIIDKVSLCFKNVGLSFQEMQKRNANNKVLNKGYEHLSTLFKSWSQDYLTEKEFIRDEIKYYFKFINKEYITFLKYYETYRMAHDHYKKTFEKMKKAKNNTKEDLLMLNDLKKYYGFELIQINDEYSNLEDRLGKRLKKQFTKYYQNRDIIFQGYQKCCKLIKFEERYTLSEKIERLENTINEYEEVIKNNNRIEDNENNDYSNNIEEDNEKNNNDYNNNYIEENNREDNNEDINKDNSNEKINDKEEKQNNVEHNITLEEEKNENKINEAKDNKINKTKKKDIKKEEPKIKEKEENNKNEEIKEENNKKEENKEEGNKEKENKEKENIDKENKEINKKEEIKEDKKEINKEELKREITEEKINKNEEIKENKEQNINEKEKINLELKKENENKLEDESKNKINGNNKEEKKEEN